MKQPNSSLILMRPLFSLSNPLNWNFSSAENAQSPLFRPRRAKCHSFTVKKSVCDYDAVYLSVRPRVICRRDPLPFLLSRVAVLTWQLFVACFLLFLSPLSTPSPGKAAQLFCRDSPLLHFVITSNSHFAASSGHRPLSNFCNPL